MEQRDFEATILPSRSKVNTVQGNNLTLLVLDLTMVVAPLGRGHPLPGLPLKLCLSSTDGKDRTSTSYLLPMSTDCLLRSSRRFPPI